MDNPDIRDTTLLALIAAGTKTPTIILLLFYGQLSGLSFEKIDWLIIANL